MDVVLQLLSDLMLVVLLGILGYMTYWAFTKPAMWSLPYPEDDDE